IDYTIEEVASLGDDYTTSIDATNENEQVITNTHTPEKIDFEGKKIWDDASNQDGKRPTTLKIILKKGNVEFKETTISGTGNEWKYKFENLDKYENGQEIKYSIDEEGVADYSATPQDKNITNSYTPGKTSVKVTKAWSDENNQDGKRPDKIEVQLKAGNTNKGARVELNGANNWTYTWSDLALKDAGTPIVYTVDEIGVPAEYNVVKNDNDHTNITLTNTYTPKT
ncbi:MAG: Cna B-type domain-containing protein, partial [Erysipelotrichales bacterium]